MKRLNYLFVLRVIFFLVMPSFGAAEKFKIDPDDLRVTQKHYGAYEVRIKIKWLENMDKFERKKFAQDNPVQAVWGFDGKLYLIDGHHMARAVSDYNLEKGKHLKVKVEVLEDFSFLSESEFWKKMAKKGWVYLYDKHGNAIDSGQLPLYVRDLTNDSFRSLAWLLRKNGVFKNLDTPFQEFKWALFLREKMQVIPDGNMAEALRLAEEIIAKDPEARKLPGYKKPKRITKNYCFGSLQELLDHIDYSHMH